jgi:peroxiredoxin
MSALTPGSKAPDIRLPLLNGGVFSLADSLSKGRVALAFFKVSCPVCQYAFPYFERLNQKLKGKQITFIGVSQDSSRDTAEFAKAFGVTFPIALDQPDGYPVSGNYGLTNVPTLFVVGEDGALEETIVSWSKSDMEDLYRKFWDSQAAGSPLFQPGEKVADFRAG